MRRLLLHLLAALQRNLLCKVLLSFVGFILYRWSVSCYMMLIFCSFLKAAITVPKKKKSMKEYNKKEAIGDLLDAFTEVCVCVLARITERRV